MSKKIFILSFFIFLVGLFLISLNKNREIEKKVYACCDLPTCFPLPSCFPLPTFPVCPTNTPIPEPTPTTVVPTNTPILPSPTPTEVLLPTETPAPTLPPEGGGPTNTPAPGPTNTPGKRPDHNTCYYQCDSDNDCHLGQDCQDVGGGKKICRNPNCPEETDCDCPGPAGGAVLGVKVSPTPKYGEVLGLAYTGSGESLALHLEGVASIIGRIMVIVGASLLL